MLSDFFSSSVFEALDESVELPEADGVELELEPLVDGLAALEPLLDGLEAEPLAEPLPEVEPLALGVSLEEELELLGLLGVALELEDELGELGVALEPLLEDEREGDEAGGVVAPEDDEDDEASFEAPRLASGPLSQPYSPPTASAIGRTTNAVFFDKLILGSS